MKTSKKVLMIVSLSVLLLPLLVACGKTEQNHHHQSSDHRHMNANQHHTRSTAKTYIDPVCNMKVTADTKWKTVHQGKTYYFCMEADKKSFDKNPAKYIKK